MRCSLDAAALLRAARARQGISQRRLALRAGTSQDAISRIERGVESPTLERLGHLLAVLGERLELNVTRLAGVEQTTAPVNARERLREAASWNLVATQLEIAGEPLAARSGPRLAGRPPCRARCGRSTADR
ncbi:MAG: helix-turn-helix domain-containing protein [Solirubrobacteraceae bacterium]